MRRYLAYPYFDASHIVEVDRATLYLPAAACSFLQWDCERGVKVIFFADHFLIWSWRTQNIFKVACAKTFNASRGDVSRIPWTIMILLSLPTKFVVRTRICARRREIFDNYIFINNFHLYIRKYIPINGINILDVCGNIISKLCSCRHKRSVVVDLGICWLNFRTAFSKPELELPKFCLILRKMCKVRNRIWGLTPLIEYTCFTESCIFPRPHVIATSTKFIPAWIQWIKNHEILSVFFTFKKAVVNVTFCGFPSRPIWESITPWNFWWRECVPSKPTTGTL